MRARARVRSPTRAQNDSVRINATPHTQRQEVHRWRQRRSLRYHEAPTAHRQELFPTAPGWRFGGHPLGGRPWSQSSQVQTPAVPYLRALLSPAGRCTWPRGSLAGRVAASALLALAELERATAVATFCNLHVQSLHAPTRARCADSSRASSCSCSAIILVRGSGLQA